jgi:2-polyprenyl-3-methyl-5-hydroxy-6-metoxy-1,4-benzoquinol methylase
LIFPNPLPRPQHLSDHYGVLPESYWRNQYFEHDERYFGKQIARAKPHLDFHEGMTALDIGVGIGKAATALVRAGFDVWGIEPSEPFHAKALEFTGLPPERIQMTSVEEATFPEESFDFITFGAVLEHLYDPSRAITRALTWLKPKGLIHIEVPSSDHLVAKIINSYFRLIGTNFVTNISPMHPPFHIHEFTLESFRLNGASSGYEIADHYYDVASIYHLPRIVHPLLRVLMARTNTGMQLTVWLRKPR